MSDLKRIEEERKRGEELFKKVRKWSLLFIAIFLILFFWYYSGKILNTKSNISPEVYKFPEDLIIGRNWTFNFSSHPILFDKKKITYSPYTFYIGSGAGSPPEGLILNENGVLTGKPIGETGEFTFEICVKDYEKNENCKIYELNVASKTDESLNINEETPNKLTGDKLCPVTSCDWECCGHITHNDGGMPDSTMIAFAVYDYCDCPSDTTFFEMQDIGDPSGRMYKMCTCNDYY